MAGNIVALDQSWIPELSQFLKAGFVHHPDDYSAFAEPAVLVWKFFQPRASWNIQRSLAVVEDSKLLAHLGVCPTDITGTALSRPVPVIHLTDWLTSSNQGSLGAMLMLKAFGNAPAQYTFGCTDVAKGVLLRVGYEELFAVPLYHHVIRPWRSGPWRQMHGRPGFPRMLAYRAFDSLQTIRGFVRYPANPAKLTISQISEFGAEAEEILNVHKLPILCTSRTPSLLNYYLSHPHSRYKGWIIRDATGKSIGFAITCTLDKPGIILGRIVELFMVEDDHAIWSWAIFQLRQKLRAEGADMISCYGSTPWFERALLACGFFRRGKTALYLRDPKKLIPTGCQWHLTHLEADLSMI
ncbi:MAG: hypothetical protein ACO1QB_04190 [Verrucomicrobiales bacterium]